MADGKLAREGKAKLEEQKTKLRSCLVFVIGRSRRLGYLRASFLALWTGGIFASPRGISRVHLVSQVLVLGLVEQLLLMLIRDDLGTIA